MVARPAGKNHGKGTAVTGTAGTGNSRFSGDSYRTPPGREALLFRLMGRSRLYCALKFAGVVLRHWQAARQGGFTPKRWHQAATEVFDIVECSGGRFHINGLEHLRATDSPVVFVANHMSTLETLVPPAFIYPHKLPVYVIKQQLLDVPLFGAYLSDCITVSRTSPAEDFKQVMHKGTATIARGASVLIFPQATRTPDLEPDNFNTLGVKLARKAGVPVIPIALRTDFWGVGRLVKDFGPLHPTRTIHFEFGPPLPVTGNGKAEHEHIVRFITDRLAQWRRRDTPAAAGS